MVHLEKVQGQKGHMIIHEDGTIIASSGDLASNETASQQVTSLMAHALPVNFNTAMAMTGSVAAMDRSTLTINGVMSGSMTGDSLANGAGASGSSSGPRGQGKIPKWNRITVNFGTHSYAACLSNRRIHVVKREHEDMGARAAAAVEKSE